MPVTGQRDGLFLPLGLPNLQAEEPENESGREEQHQQHHCPESGIHQVLDLRRSGAYTIRCKTKQHKVVKAALLREGKSAPGIRCQYQLETSISVK